MEKCGPDMREHACAITNGDAEWKHPRTERGHPGGKPVSKLMIISALSQLIGNIRQEGWEGTTSHSGGVAGDGAEVLSHSETTAAFFLLGNKVIPGHRRSDICIKVTAGRDPKKLNHAGSSTQYATESQESDSMRTTCT
jgi:hypothetical protein